MKISVNRKRSPLVTRTNRRHQGVKMIPAETFAMAISYVDIIPDFEQTNEQFEHDYVLIEKIMNAMKDALVYNGLVESLPDLSLHKLRLTRTEQLMPSTYGYLRYEPIK